MNPVQVNEFWLYYAAVTVVALFLLLRPRPKHGMRLRLRGGRARGAKAPAPPSLQLVPDIRLEPPPVERPLNVVFNHNGHSWDAYEVLGLPAGSSLEKVDVAFRECVAKVDFGSKPFIEAAYQAIQSQWKASKASNDS